MAARLWLPEPTRDMAINVLQMFRTPSVHSHIAYTSKNDFMLNLEEEICAFSDTADSDDSRSGWSRKKTDKWTEEGWLLPPAAASGHPLGKALGSEPPCHPEAGSEPPRHP